MIQRIGAVVALGLAVFVAGYLLLTGGSSYEITAEFQSASQLVAGNQVKIGGSPVGTVEQIDLGDDGTALLRFSVDEEWAPLPANTIATVRSDSLSGVANRYIDLVLPPDDDSGGEILDGGTLGLSNTISEVDVDQLFNTLDEKTIEDFKRVIRGFAAAYSGPGVPRAANRSFHYLNPFFSTARQLFDELTLDRRSLERFVVDTAGLSKTLASRSADAGLLVENLDRMMGAIANRETDLRAALGELPQFMREFNTAAVNTRAALDDLTPLVTEATPVARQLRPFARRLRGFATSSVPAIRSLRLAIDREGNSNDLIELVALLPDLREIAVGPVSRNGATRAGALSESIDALTDSLPVLAFLRPYVTIEGVSGWFRTFSRPGYYDANGAIGRLSANINVFAALPSGLPNLLDQLSPDEVSGALSLDNTRRCPGANERDPGDGSTPFTDGGQLDCDPTQIPVGP